MTPRTGLAVLLIALAACRHVPAPPADRVPELNAGDARPPSSPAVVEQLRAARAKLRAGQLAEAAAAAQRIATAEPHVAAARLLLGEALTGLAAATSHEPGRAGVADLDLSEDAEVELLTAVRLAPHDPAAHTALGALYEVDGHLEAALASYAEALRHAAFHRPALLAAARLATELGRERGAIRHLEALSALPNFPTEAVLWQARCYLTLSEDQSLTREQRHTHLTRARGAFIELSKRRPADARGPAGEAYCRFKQALATGSITDAEKQRIRSLYQRAARLAPADPLPRFNHARLLESKLVGDSAAALAEYDATLERDAMHVPSLLNSARLLWLAGRKAAAKARWRKALPLLTDDREKKKVAEMLGR